MAVSDIRFKRLGHVVLNVSDVPRSARFYEEVMGLQRVSSPREDLAFFRCSDRRQDLVLTTGAAPGLKRIGWQMESPKALAAVRQELSSLGLPVVPVSNEELEIFGLGEAFRSVEPTTGAVYEFYVDVAAAERPFEPSHTKIVRLGHIVLYSADRAATERFLMDHLNFRVSDRLDGMVTFMRCFPNPLHHSFGVGQAPHPGLNHVMFMVSEIDDIGRALNRIKARDVPVVFGPGRHPPSGSVFLYFLDPDGMTVEYSFGMEEFPEVAPREPRNLPPKIESLDYWGGIPDPRFAKVGRIETLA